MKDFIKSWDELGKIETFEGRVEYLRTYSTVGEPTFGYDRWINQKFYRIAEYRRLRQKIAAKQYGWDLGIKGYPLPEVFILHHMNPITVEDVINRNHMVFDPENVITTTLNTHNAIHYGDKNLLIRAPIERSQYDTCPWKH